MTINLVCVGNLKEKFSKDEQAEYVKRLSAFCKLNIVEIKEQNHLQNSALILEKEGEDILKNLKGYVILCDIKSKELSSEEFARKIENLMQTNSAITFVIGGSFGVSDKVKANCNEKISFSPMTFPHNLFRIMLLEQIYRAFTIMNGKTYHK
ncbi:MAG: 23S rRNA (pseudouridine(1915)-N(3))-methyltransferase RlmH [Clostridia bacterium]|nr:23S rRNA (pseudouridine(1915)-N(3))-methyltransferase RlmH [Clostridia bacterium]